MNNDVLMCEHCGQKITIYFDNEYDGKRGKCLSCGTDFPLTWGIIMSENNDEDFGKFKEKYEKIDRLNVADML